MAKKAGKKAAKKKKQSTRVSTTTKSRVKASVSVRQSALDMVTASSRSEAQGRHNAWGWPAYLGLALAVLILFLSAWLIFVSYYMNYTKPPQQSAGSGGVPIPLSGTANPQQLQAGTSTNVQSGQAPQGESNGANNPQPQQTLSPDQYRALQ